MRMERVGLYTDHTNLGESEWAGAGQMAAKQFTLRAAELIDCQSNSKENRKRNTLSFVLGFGA